jgi:hypothetical protein
VSDPYVELYKIENFPAVPNAKDVHFNCDDTDTDTTCKNYPEMIEMLKNKNFKLVLDKIQGNSASNQSGDPSYFHGINFDGNFSSPIETAYAQISGDGFLYIVDSLSQFDDGYQTEEEWGVEDWRKL